jgi:hypothetical protein
MSKLIVLTCSIAAVSALVFGARITSNRDEAHEQPVRVLTHDSRGCMQRVAEDPASEGEHARVPVLAAPAAASVIRPSSPPDDARDCRVLLTRVQELTRELDEERVGFGHREDNYKRELHLLREQIAKSDPQGWLAAFIRSADHEGLDQDARERVRVILDLFPVILTPGEATLLANFTPQGNYTRELVDLLGGPARILHDLLPTDIERMRRQQGDEFMQEYMGLKPKN